MANTISEEISVKASAAKPSGEPSPGDKTLGLEPVIRFYAIEDVDETEEGEEAEILVVHESSLAVSKQNPIKRKSPYIDMLDHEGPSVVSAMCNLTIGVFEYLEITSPVEVDKGVAYAQRTLKGAVFKNYREVLVGCRRSAKELAGDEWNLVKLAGLSADDFCTWVKTDSTGYDKHAYLVRDKCIYFER